MGIFEKIFGDANARFLKRLQPLVDTINSLEAGLARIESNELKNKTAELKERLAKGETLDHILPEAFALVREASKRTLKQRHFDVQLLGGIVLHQGQIAEMRTGEGKTLTSTLAVYLNALAGTGVHVITVNDYLAKRDAVWMGQIYDLLGLTIGVLQHDSAFVYDASYIAPEQSETERDRGVVVNENYLKPVARQQAYLADITYGTNHEFGFDYLRDNMVSTLEQMAQRDLAYAIIDEVDSILIDEARTPLIISAPAEQSTEMYRQFAQLVRRLKENEDFNIDEKMRAVTLTEEGINKMEQSLGVANIYEAGGMATVHHLESALKAETLFKRDKDYVVKEGEIIIVDEFTGRLMFGRRYSEGLHQAIEAKEGVAVQRESVTMATITLQNYFRMYKKLAGMTGTAATESEEFSKIYNLDVTVIPTNKPMVRQDNNDLIYKTEEGKFKAVIEEIKARRDKGQPVLAGTISIEKNEFLSELLNKNGIKHEILNAKNHEREAQIIAQAGKPGAITLATNMAGRGVDIILGGNPADASDALKVKEAGGLHIIGTERHESRRIDNQLRGRSGRQGDPGSSRFFVSLDDDLMRIFGGERIKSLMTTLRVPEDMPIENAIITKSLESAQKKVEGNNFDIRKHLVEYDDVLNKHRDAIYKKRRAILENPSSAKEMAWEMVGKEIEDMLEFHSDLAEGQGDEKELVESVSALFPITDEEKDRVKSANNPEELKKYILDLAKQRFDKIGENIVQQLPAVEAGQNHFANLCRGLLLNAIDTLWIEHLSSIDYLRTGIGLQGYGQRDPLVEYKHHAFDMFKRLLATIQSEVSGAIFKLGQAAVIASSPMARQNIRFSGPGQAGPRTGAIQQSGEGQRKQAEATVIPEKPKNEFGQKIGRNDSCPCGSGLKFKKCHGR